MKRMSNIERYNEIGRAIKESRKEREYNQEQFADALGISKSYLSKIEAPNTDKSFSIELLFNIADFLEIDVKELFKYVD